LKDNLDERKELRENVLREASLISFEENYELKECCFAELKDNVVNKKMKRLSRRKYAL